MRLATHRLGVCMLDPDADAGGGPVRSPGLSLKGRALRYLSAREHSRAELVRKLAPHASSREQLDLVLDELQAKDFISEARVAESVVHRRASRLGAARVKQDLLIKGLSAEVIATAMAGLKSTELARARAVWRKKFSEPARDAAGRGKQMRFLVSRGFSADLVQRVLAGRDDESHNDCSDHSGV